MGSILMDLLINPRKLEGQIRLPGSKSYGHRAILLSALSQKQTLITGMDLNDDLCHSLDFVKTLAGNYQVLDDGILIDPVKRVEHADLYFGESGSTLRMYLPTAVALCPSLHLHGAPSLCRRPIDEMIDLFQDHSVRCSSNSLPFSTKGLLTGGFFKISGKTSSQYLSGLLMASVLWEDFHVEWTHPSSQCYIAITKDAISSFVPDQGFYRGPGQYHVEEDFSQAAFFLVANELGSRITFDLPKKSVQGDQVILDFLKEKPNEISFDSCPDLFPIYAVFAANGKQPLYAKDLGRLRLKESDRIASTKDMIQSLGGKMEIQGDEAIIFPTGLRGGTVDSHGDHRIAMATAIASTVCEKPVRIRNAQVVNKSYPDFFDDFQSLGGDCHLI
ncbi:MAG: hypothetical protein Q4P25_04430 [Tissierellia bacterium]|nr:hypothetical protein [Tissierellia bacterium]